MADEPRRSGRATKGQHNKNASSSPAPPSKPAPKGTAKSKPSKKSNEPEPEDDEEEVIRCICGNTNPKDKRAFIGCDACTVWQHNVCMGLPDDEDDVPEHYFCEECRPEEHEETLQAMARGDKIWETRNKAYQNEKKMSKSRKSRGKHGEEYRPSWLKKDVAPQQQPAESTPAAEPEPVAQATTEKPEKPEAGNKRKREPEPKEEPQEQPAPEEKPTRSGRQEKRRKSSQPEGKVVMDTSTAVVPIKELPKDRQSVAQALSKIITADIQQRVKSGFKLPANQTPSSVGEHYASLIEYELQMNHGSKDPGYKQQFIALNANLKRNNVLIERLMNGTLNASELSTMNTTDMASEDLQRERAVMKEELDRQAIAVEETGPRYKQDHKGFHEIETPDSYRDEPAPQPVSRPSISQDRAGQSGSPVNNQNPLTVNTNQQADGGVERRPSSQQFDMNNIWAKTANSPTGTGPRPMQINARRPSAPAPKQQNGAQEDADIDRMLDDNDESYEPAEATGADAIVWRGKLMQANEDEAPTVNARFVAGRDLAPTTTWQGLFPERLSIDGRLAIEKAEEYLCGLRWSNSSDVTVLALTPYDNLEAFNTVFNYFHSRNRYAVVEKTKPRMMKDFYIIPVEAGQDLPPHVGMLEHCTIKTPIEERLLLATVVVARAPEDPPVNAADSTPTQVSTNGHLPPHVRQSIGGPAGSPLNTQNPTFSPSNNAPSQPPQAGYGAPMPGQLPPNPYGPPPAQAQQPVPPHAQAQGPSLMLGPPQYPHQPQGQLMLPPKAQQILGDALIRCPTAQMILANAPDIDEERLKNLKHVLEQDPSAQTDWDVLSRKLFS